MRERRWGEVSIDAGVAKKAGVKRTMRNQRLVRGLSKSEHFKGILLIENKRSCLKQTWQKINVITERAHTN